MNSYKVYRLLKVNLSWKTRRQSELIKSLKRDTAQFAIKELGIKNPLKLQVRMQDWLGTKLPIARICYSIKNPKKDYVELSSSTFDYRRNTVNYENVKLAYRHELVHLAFTLQGYSKIIDGSELFEDVLHHYGLTTNEKTEKTILVAQSIDKEESLWTICSCGEEWVFPKSELRKYKKDPEKINPSQYTGSADHVMMGHRVNIQIKDDFFKFPSYQYEADNSKPSFQNVINKLDEENGKY